MHLDPAEIFKSEAEEAHEKTRKAIEICSCFKEQFEEIRKNIQKFFKEGQEVKQWEFANELVFTRIDQFVRRLRIVEVSLCEIIPVLPLLSLRNMLQSETEFIIYATINCKSLCTYTQ